MAKKLLTLSYLFNHEQHRLNVFNFLKTTKINNYTLSSYLESLKRFDASKEDWDLMAKLIESSLSTMDKDDQWQKDDLQWQLASIYFFTEEYKKSLNYIKMCTWSNNDLLEYSKKEVCDVPVTYILAKSLIETGKKEHGIKILEQSLFVSETHDPAYELLLKHSPKALITLNKLFEFNPFEERPLIWKAKILISQGKIQEAEETITQAISIDPSDGEMGPGERMRVYGVLAEIKKLQGKEKDVKFLDGVLMAIRESEKADLYYQAGLIPQSIDMYVSSLKHFSDAYCIQSRTALRLSQSGRYKEAAPYFKRAFELMPDSFGRVESHCFGCEGIFSTQQAATIAQEVFSKLLKESPEKAQLHYLMGYLLESQDKDKEAISYYQKAVELDPLYINAWKNLLSIYDELGNKEELSKHFMAFIDLEIPTYQIDLNYFKSFSAKQIWTTVNKKKAHSIEVTNLFPLKKAESNIHIYMSSLDNDLRQTHPGVAIAIALGYSSIFDVY